MAQVYSLESLADCACVSSAILDALIIFLSLLYIPVIHFLCRMGDVYFHIWKNLYIPVLFNNAALYAVSISEM